MVQSRNPQGKTQNLFYQPYLIPDCQIIFLYQHVIGRKHSHIRILPCVRKQGFFICFMVHIVLVGNGNQSGVCHMAGKFPVVSDIALSFPDKDGNLIAFCQSLYITAWRRGCLLYTSPYKYCPNLGKHLYVVIPA